MESNYLIEYPAYWLIRLLGVIVTALPLRLNYMLGRFVGLSCFFLLRKKKNLVIKNLKRAFPGYEYYELERIAKGAFVSLALNIVEALYIPKINARYINKHMRIENLKYLDDALSKGKGVILLAYHFGNWELANVTCGLLGYSYKVVVNEQRYPLINNLLNRYRESKGCKTIPRGVAVRQIVKVLQDNKVVALVGDQGGRDGMLINFLGVPTTTPQGAARFAMSTGAAVIPVLIMRERRFYHRIILEEQLKIENTGNTENDIEKALKQSNRILEEYVLKYPQEYFWFYKIWKYSPVKSVVILSDGKAGHLRQSQAVWEVISNYQIGNYFPEVLPSLRSEVIEVRFKNQLSKKFFHIGLVMGINFLKPGVTNHTYRALKRVYADLVISSGSSLSGVNLLLARENLAKSICIMKPSFFSPGRFHMLIAPRHDKPAPKKNVVITEGALNLIDEEYMRKESDKLKMRYPHVSFKPSIGLLIGGDTREYKLTKEIMEDIIQGLKDPSAAFDLGLLITTSRRTSKAIEALIKDRLKDCGRCKLLVIANEENIPEAVGGILGLSDFVVVSGESISMVSEAAASGKYTLVFRLKARHKGKKRRHEAFLRNLEKQGHIYIVEPKNIAGKIEYILKNKPEIKKLDDRSIVEEAIRKLL